MSMKVESVDQNRFGLKVEGDLGDLQIIEESSDEDTSERQERPSPVPAVSSLARLPNGLIQGNVSSAPVVGAVHMANSDNAHFGNNTYFHGPVTIKQIVQAASGVNNASYQKTEDENIPTINYHHNKESLSKQKIGIKSWHKWLLSAVGGIVLVIICAIAVILQQNKNQDSPSASESNDQSNNNAQVLVTGCSDNVYILGFSVFFIVLTYFLLVAGSLLTNRGGYSYYDGRCKDRCNIDFKDILHNPQKLKADDLLIAPDHLRIVSRTDWLAQPVSEKIEAIRQPVPWVIITHTATPPCFQQSSCVLAVRLMQTFHIESKGWSDIAYNFLVGGDGSAYFGRGWDQVGAHTLGYNRYAIAIAFIGTFNTEKPTQHQIDACRKLIKLGVAKNKIDKNYNLLAHRQLMSTLSPGDTVFNIIKTWPHFYNDTDITPIIPKY